MGRSRREAGTPLSVTVVVCLYPSQIAPNQHSFTHTQATTGFYDEVRVWSTVRSPSQIRTNYKRSIDVAHHPEASDLSLYWRFDVQGGLKTGEYTIEQDLSEEGASPGLVGDMPTIENHMQYITSKVI